MFLYIYAIALALAARLMEGLEKHCRSIRKVQQKLAVCE
jgi:hypothetical protein